jgi:hypothetical protein
MKLLLPGLLLCLALQSNAQQHYFTRNGTVTFFSSTPLEDIKAENYSVTAVLNLSTGDVEYSMLIKSFNFKKALMQEHFNENYMESHKYPKASFKGKVAGIEQLQGNTTGSFNVVVTGNLTMHGMTREVSTPGTLSVDDGKVTARATFTVKPEDYDIAIPPVVRDKIAREIEITVLTTLDPLKR